jgi:hypothetical protein
MQAIGMENRRKFISALVATCASPAFVLYSQNAAARESPNRSRGRSITTEAGETFSLGAPRPGGFTTLINGVPWPEQSPGGAVEYYYSKPNVYCLNDAGIWHLRFAAGWTPAADPTMTGATTGAQENLDVTRGESIKDSLGRVWTLGPPNPANGVRAVLRDGRTFTNAGSAIELLYFRKLVFAKRSPGNGNWVVWYDATPTIGDFVPIFGNDPTWGHYFSGTPAPNESKHGTRGSAVTDAVGAAWTLGPGGAARRNGTKPGQGGTGVEYTYMNHCVVLKNAAGDYYEWNADDYGGTFVAVGRADPLLIEKAVSDGSPIDEGLRGTMRESALQTAKEIIFYGKVDKASAVANFGYPTDPAYSAGLHSFKKWPDYGNVDVIRVAGAIKLGPNMLNSTRHVFTVPLDKAWLHQSIMVDHDLPNGMHEQGIKLSGLEGDVSVRLWMRKPYRCLPNQLRLAIYVYDASSGGGYGETIDATGFLKAGVKDGLSLYVELNSFNPDGTPKPDGKYIVRQSGRTILNVTNRVNRSNPAQKLKWQALQVYHGGMGCPYGDIHVELGPNVTASVDPGFMKPTSAATRS